MASQDSRDGHQVLKALDKAKTQAYHMKTIVIAGAGFFTDSYDLFVIGLLTKLLGRIYYRDQKNSLPINVAAAVNATAFCGTLAGQLFFGWAGDRWGRKAVYGTTLLILIVSSIGQGLSFGSTANAVMTTLCFFRFWLGFGIGGEYPLSATIMSEYSNVRTRGSFVAAVFAMQGIGYLAAGTLTIIVSQIFMINSHDKWVDPNDHSKGYICPHSADYVWRIILMAGAIPAIFTLWFRYKMPETARYTALVRKNEAKAVADMAKVLHQPVQSEDFSEKWSTVSESKAHAYAPQSTNTEWGLRSREFARRHGKQLFGVCACWFLLDISYYSQNLFQTRIFSDVGWVPAASGMTALYETFRLAKATTLLALFSTVPGYWVTVVLVDRIGRKPIQLLGFLMMSIFMFIIGGTFYKLRGHQISKTNTDLEGGNHILFIVLYACTFFFSNFGPNATTFIVPSELFPARLRSTCHGIASAAGKAGAIAGSFGFLYASVDKRVTPIPPPGYNISIGYANSFYILGACAALGFIITVLCIPETKGRSLEDLSGENEDDNAAAQARTPV